MNNQQPNVGQLQANVDLKTLPKVECEKCKNQVFISGYMLLKVSPLISSTGKAGYMPVPTFACSTCGHVNKELNPLKEKNDDIDDAKIIKNTKE